MIMKEFTLKKIYITLIICLFSFLSSYASSRSESLYEKAVTYAIKERFIEAYLYLDSVSLMEKKDRTIPQYMKSNVADWEKYISTKLGSNYTINNKRDTYPYMPCNRINLKPYANLLDMDFSHMGERCNIDLLQSYANMAIADTLITKGFRRQIVLSYVKKLSDIDPDSKYWQYLLNEVNSINDEQRGELFDSEYLYDILQYLLSKLKGDVFAIISFDNSARIIVNEMTNRDTFHYGKDIREEINIFIEATSAHFGKNSTEVLDLMRVFLLCNFEADSLIFKDDYNLKEYEVAILGYEYFIDNCILDEASASPRDYERLVLAYGILANYYRLYGNKQKSAKMLLAVNEIADSTIEIK